MERLAAGRRGFGFPTAVSKRVSVIRNFPLWPDFQPIVQLYGFRGSEQEIAFADSPLPPTGVGACGVSEAALQKFQTVAELAQKHHLKLIVSLVTGWMSGELFVPPALRGKNLLTEPTALAWEQRYVKTFVHCFKAHPAIIGWVWATSATAWGRWIIQPSLRLVGLNL